MVRYRVFGVGIESAFELPGLPPVSDLPDPDVRVVPGRIDDGTARQSGIRLSTPRGPIDVSRERIVVDEREPGSGDGAPSLATYLLGGALGALFHLRGRLVLHASAVVWEGRTLAFLGDSGTGKSTTAATLAADGGRVLADDVLPVVVDPDGDCAGGTSAEPPAVPPGPPVLKLDVSVGDELDGGEPVERVGDGTDRRFYRFDGVDDARTVDGVYVLGYDDRGSVKGLSPNRGAIELVRNTYPVYRLTATDEAVENLQQCTAAVERVPVARLVRRDGEMDREELLERLRETLSVIDPH